MKIPELERLIDALGEDAGTRIYELFKGETDPMDYSDVSAWVGGCYNPPPRIEQLMCAANQIIEGHGCEAIFGVGAIWPDVEYVNTGDTYNTTLLFDYLENRLMITTWGDWIEYAEKQGRRYE